MTELIQVRIALLTFMMAVIALAAGDVFDQIMWWFLVPPVLVGLGAWWSWDRVWFIRLGVMVATIVVGSSAVVAAAGGSSADEITAFGVGVQRILSTEWPSPDRPDLLGTIAVALGIGTAAAAELARRVRFHLSPLLPVLVVQVALTALSAPAGVELWWVFVLALSSLAFATLRPGSETALIDRLALLRGERRLIPLTALAIVAAAIGASLIVLAGRADPRRPESADRSAAVIDPIEATLALQAIEPAIALHDIRITGERDESTAPPIRWRTAALEVYDGRRWSPDVVLRPIGRRLGDAQPDEYTYAVTFENDDLRFVPLPGAPIVIDAQVETDDDRTIVGLIDRPAPGVEYEVATLVEPDLASAQGAIGTRDLDDGTTAFAELALELATQGGADESSDAYDRLQAIEATMRDVFLLRSDAAGGGLQRALIERFLRETREGNAEQFATAFVLLAHSLGVDARVATGFLVDPESLDAPAEETLDSTLTLLSSDAAVWPEVRVGDHWVAFDPVPEEETSDAAPPPPEPRSQTPAVPQPPIPPPPENPDEPRVADEADEADAASGLPVVLVVTLYVLAGVGVLLVPVAIFLGIVLGWKWRRRRIKLSGSPAERIHGAWSLTTNALVDGGMRIAFSDTNGDIAVVAEDYAPAARREIHRLSQLANASTFGDPPHPDLLAEDASVCFDRVEMAMTEERTRWQRARWRLSLRSVRPSTTSPV